MSRYCPVTKNKVPYLTCMECEERVCEENSEELNDDSTNTKEVQSLRETTYN